MSLTIHGAPTPDSLTTRRTVISVIPSGPISETPRPLATPNAHDGGNLLAGDCASTSYTLVNGGDLVLYAAFVGCGAERPECCPWDVSTDAPPGNPGSGPPEGGHVAAAGGDFPIPAADVKDRLERCPQDYYSVSGQCCPK